MSLKGLLLLRNSQLADSEPFEILTEDEGECMRADLSTSQIEQGLAMAFERHPPPGTVWSSISLRQHAAGRRTAYLPMEIFGKNLRRKKRGKPSKNLRSASKDVAANTTSNLFSVYAPH